MISKDGFEATSMLTHSEKIIQLAILDKLEVVISEKIRLLKEERAKHKPEQDHNPGNPTYQAAIVRYVKETNEEEKYEDTKADKNYAADKNTQILSHSFRISTKTTFKDLRDAAIEFWCKDERKVNPKNK